MIGCAAGPQQSGNSRELWNGEVFRWIKARATELAVTVVLSSALLKDPIGYMGLTPGKNPLSRVGGGAVLSSPAVLGLMRREQGCLLLV